MSACTNIPGGFIRRAPNDNTARPNYTLWHLSMSEAGFNPTAYVEPVLRFNRTGNPILSQWSADYRFKLDWVNVMLVSLGRINRLSVIPHIFASFEQMSMESEFPFP